MSGTAGGTGFKILFFKILKDGSAKQKRGFIRILERTVEMPLVGAFVRAVVGAVDGGRRSTDDTTCISKTPRYHKYTI